MSANTTAIEANSSAIASTNRAVTALTEASAANSRAIDALSEASSAHSRSIAATNTAVAANSKAIESALISSKANSTAIQSTNKAVSAVVTASEANSTAISATNRAVVAVKNATLANSQAIASVTAASAANTADIEAQQLANDIVPRLLFLHGRDTIWSSKATSVTLGGDYGTLYWKPGGPVAQGTVAFDAKGDWSGYVWLMAVSSNGAVDTVVSNIDSGTRSFYSGNGVILGSYKYATALIFPTSTIGPDPRKVDTSGVSYAA